jgi:uncharacterized protein
MVTPFNSALYDCQALHQRSRPKRYGFRNRLFQFYLDLDELETLDRALWGVTYNRPGVFAFYDDDHFPGYTGPLKERVCQFLAENGVATPAHKIYLLCHLRVLGYVFNPVSFYFCYDAEGSPLCAIAEVENTFYEIKPFVVPHTPQAAYDFSGRATKWFYVSPFSQLDLAFDLRLAAPGETLDLHVHSIEARPSNDTEAVAPKSPILVSWLKGRRLTLNGRNLLMLALKYPLMPLQVIAFIHWHALWLALKGVPFAKKEAHPENQRGVLRPHPSLKQPPI